MCHMTQMFWRMSTNSIFFQKWKFAKIYAQRLLMRLNSAKYYQIKQHHMKALLFQQNLKKKEGNIFLAEAFGKAISEVVYS